jgi:hypothetical protein
LLPTVEKNDIYEIIMDNINITIKDLATRTTHTYSVNPQVKLSDFLRSINQTNKELVIDRLSTVSRIVDKDVTARYYGARPHDIFRTTDGSSIGYRIVKKEDVVITKSTPVRINNLHLKAHRNLLHMIADRTDDQSLLDSLSLGKDGIIKNITDDGKGNKIITSHGRTLLVFFLTDEESMLLYKMNKSRDEMIAEYMKEALEQTNDSPHNLDVILVYNNVTGNQPNMKKHRDLQIFSLQELAIRVIKHVDQPEFTLLHPVKDAKEIRDVIGGSGGSRLDHDATFNTNGIINNTNLVLV